jgi:hypothetical protein
MRGPVRSIPEVEANSGDLDQTVNRSWVAWEVSSSFRVEPERPQPQRKPAANMASPERALSPRGFYPLQLRAHESLIQHRVRDFQESPDVRAVDVVSRRSEALRSLNASLVDVLHDDLELAVDFSRISPARMFCDIRGLDRDLPAFAAFPGRIRF